MIFLQDNSSLPSVVKWDAIDLHLIERSAEEQIRIVDDLESAISSFTDMHACMHA